MKSIIKLGFIFLFTMFFSCKQKDPCDKGETSTNNIPEKTRLKVPYQNFAELTFIDSTTQDTHVFVGKGWNATYWYYNDYSNECQNGSNNEKYFQNFYSLSYPNPISISIEYTNPCCEYIVVSIEKSIFYMAPSGLRAPYSYDSILIAKKLYRNVEYFKNEYQPQWNTKYGCYFNTSEGVLKIELPNGPLELVSFRNP